MLNQVILVGRLTTIKTIKTKESERTVITLAEKITFLSSRKAEDGE